METFQAGKVIGGIKNVTVKSGKILEFESLFKELAQKVKENEQGCNYYDLYRTSKERSYVVMEQYRDNQALKEHQESSYGSEYFPKMRAIIEKLEVTYFEPCIILEEIRN